jgi:hypothetical protein
MSLSVRSPDSHAIGTGTAPTLAEPSGTAPGDFLLALGVADALTGFAPPPEWTKLYSVRTTGAFPVDAHLVFIQRRTTAPNLVWALTGSHYREVYILAVTSSLGWPIRIDALSQSGAFGTTSSAAHNPDPPAVSAVAPSCLSIAGGMFYGGSTTAWGASAGYVIQTNNVAGNDGLMEAKTLASSGNEDPGVTSGGAGSFSRDFWDGFTLTLVESIERPKIWSRPFPFSPGSPPSRNPPYR